MSISYTMEKVGSKINYRFRMFTNRIAARFGTCDLSIRNHKQYNNISTFRKKIVPYLVAYFLYWDRVDAEKSELVEHIYHSIPIIAPISYKYDNRIVFPNSYFIADCFL